MTELATQKAPRLVGLRGAKLAPLWEETGVRWVLQARPTRRCDGGHIPETKKGHPKAAERQSAQEAREGYRPLR